MNILPYFEQLNLSEWIFFSLLINLLLFLCSIVFYRLTNKICSKAKIQQQDTPITTADLLLSFITVLLNSLVMLIAVYFWKLNWIELNQSKSLIALIMEIVAVIVMMDLLMFIFHYLAHLPFFYKLVHYKHHEHTNTNYLSLFVLHPFETLGFGMMMILVFIAYDFSIISISIYLFINLIWGTIGHLNREFFPKWTERFFLGTTRFHHQHHLDEQHNFGFYTSIWDRLFKTFKH